MKIKSDVHKNMNKHGGHWNYHLRLINKKNRFKTIFEFGINFRTNLSNTEDYRKYDRGEIKLKYYPVSFWLTVLSNKYYLITVSCAPYYKSISFFRKKYGQEWVLFKIDRYLYLDPYYKIRKFYRRKTGKPIY